MNQKLIKQVYLGIPDGGGGRRNRCTFINLF